MNLFVVLLYTVLAFLISVFVTRWTLRIGTIVDNQQAVADKLDAILEELRRFNNQSHIRNQSAEDNKQGAISCDLIIKHDRNDPT